MHPEHTALYLYAIAPYGAAPMENMQGLQGSRVYAVSDRDICVLVHDCSLEAPAPDGDAVRELVYTHHRVVEEAWSRCGTIVPMRFDVVVKGGEGRTARDNLVQWLSDGYDDYRAMLDFFRERAEYHVKVSCREDQILAALEESEEMKQTREGAEALPRGRAFFYRRKLAELAREKLRGHLRRLQEAFLEALDAVADDVQRAASDGKAAKEMLNLSVLAHGRRIERLGAVLAEMEAHRGISVSFTGPWPPYSFVFSPRSAEMPGNNSKMENS